MLTYKPEIIESEYCWYFL